VSMFMFQASGTPPQVPGVESAFGDGNLRGSITGVRREDVIQVAGSSMPMMGVENSAVQVRNKPWYRSRWFWVAVLVAIVIGIVLFVLLRADRRRRLPP